MLELNVNYWGLICVPLGILICFGPVLFAWLSGSSKAPGEDNRGKGP